MAKHTHQPRDANNQTWLPTDRCPTGHEYSPENTLFQKGRRGKPEKQCRECNRLRMLRRANDPKTKGWRDKQNERRRAERATLRSVQYPTPFEHLRNADASLSIIAEGENPCEF